MNVKVGGVVVGGGMELDIFFYNVDQDSGGWPVQ